MNEDLFQPTDDTYEPVDDLQYAGLASQVAKAIFGRSARRGSAEKGAEEYISREAKKLEPEISHKAEDMVKTDLKMFLDETKTNPMKQTESHQFNFDAINTPEDVRKELAIMNEFNKDAITTQRRGVVTDKELNKLSSDLSTDTDTIKTVLGLKAGEILPAEYVRSMQDTLLQSGDRLKDLSLKITTGEATQKDVLAFHKQWEFHSQFATQFMGVRAEYGRGFRSFDNATRNAPLEELMNRASAGSLDPMTMAQQLLMANDTKSITKTVRNQKGVFSLISDMGNELFINGILSGMQTHIVNSIGNALKAVITPLDTFAGSFFKSGGSDGMVTGEAVAQLRGMMEAQQEALSMAFKTLKTGQPYGGVDRLEFDYTRAISSNALGIREGTTGAEIVDAVGEAVRTPTANLMGAEDAFFKVLHEKGKIRQLAHRQATRDGLVGEEYDNFIAMRMENPTKDMRQEATQSALEGTFQQSGGKIIEVAQKIRQFPAMRFVIPFVRTPVNLFSEGLIDRNILIAPLTKKYRDALAKGGADAQMVKGKLAIGTALNSTLLGFAMNGHVTGSYPRDHKMRELMYANGIQEESFVTNNEDGTKNYYSFSRLEPYNSILKLYANVAQTFHFATFDPEDPEINKEVEKLGEGLGLALSEATVNQVFMKGLHDFLAISEAPEKAYKLIENIASGMVPFSSALANVRKSLDPFIRDSDGILERIQNRIPFMSEKLPPTLDIFGKKAKYTNNLLPHYMVQGKRDTDDPVYQEVFRIADTIKTVPIFKPKKTIGSYSLTNYEYYDYVDFSTNTKIGDKNLYGRVKDVMKKPVYQNNNDYVKANILDDIRKSHYEYGKQMLKQKYPHIQKYDMDVKEYRMKLLTK